MTAAIACKHALCGFACDTTLHCTNAVVVRVRPMFPAEVAKGATNVITVAEDCSSLQVTAARRWHRQQQHSKRRGETRSAATAVVAVQHAGSTGGCRAVESSTHTYAASDTAPGAATGKLCCTSSHPFSDFCVVLQVVVPGPGGATMQRDFSFHACLGPEVSQADVMDLCGIHQLLDAALAGYHVTIFAYGQTGGLLLLSCLAHTSILQHSLHSQCPCLSMNNTPGDLM